MSKRAVALDESLRRTYDKSSVADFHLVQHPLVPSGERFSLSIAGRFYFSIFSVAFLFPRSHDKAYTAWQSDSPDSHR